MGSMEERDGDSEGEDLEEEGDRGEEARGVEESGEEEMEEGDGDIGEGETVDGSRSFTERNCAKSARYFIFSLLLVFHVFLMLAGRKEAGVLVPEVVFVLVLVVLTVVVVTLVWGLYRLSN